MRQTILQQLLKDASLSIGALDAELLLSHILGETRESIVAHPERQTSWLSAHRFRHLAQKRKKGIPLAYLTGHKEFFGLDFIVNKDVLTPRPETETMVEAVLEEMEKKKWEKRNVFLVDVGTGSGCIPIATVKTLQHSDTSTLQHVYGMDISRPSLRVAKKNAMRHGVDITFLKGSLLQPLLKTRQLYPPDFATTKSLRAGNSTTLQLIITANLPYLTAAQYQSEPSIQHEPKRALVAGGNGLALYEELVNQIKSFISSFPHFPIACFLEINSSQADAITDLIRQALPDADARVKKDLAGRDRVVVIRKDT